MRKLFSQLTGFIALLMGTIVYFAFSWGFVLYKYWYWFLVDVFPNLPSITFKEAVGLKMILGIVVTTVMPTLREDLYKNTSIERATTTVIMPWLSLLIGYVVYLCLL